MTTQIDFDNQLLRCFVHMLLKGGNVYWVLKEYAELLAAPRGVNVGGWFTPPEKWSSRSQTKCSRSQNYAFVYMQCFAKQIKYSGETRDWVMSIELEICSNGSNSSEIIWRNITYLFRAFMNELSVKTRTKGWSFHLLSKHGDIYMSRLRVGTFIWNLGSARSFTGDILY
jgi:hypothetical protein